MRAAKIDANQTEIVRALQAHGCMVQSLAGMGRGVPDLLVGRHGRLMLIEVKGPKGSLTYDQVEWHAAWQGYPIHVVRTVEEALWLVKD